MSVDITRNIFNEENVLVVNTLVGRVLSGKLLYDC